MAKFEPHVFLDTADVANFTAWSSVREPVQVFTLLEGVYNKFDTIAKKRRVFKVRSSRKEPVLRDAPALSCCTNRRFQC